MKKYIIFLIIGFSLNSQAQLADFFDKASFLNDLFNIGQAIVVNVAKAEANENQNLADNQQTQLACEITEAINPHLKDLNKKLIERKINMQYGCAPITTALRLQIDILGHCQEFYNNPKVENQAFLKSKFLLSLVAAKLILTKCYPEIGNIKLPMP